MSDCYTDDCLTIKTRIRQEIVLNLTRKVKGYIYIVFTDNDDMVVRLLDKENNTLHKAKIDNIIDEAVKGFDIDKFCKNFVSDFRKEINKKYFKNPLDYKR